MKSNKIRCLTTALIIILSTFCYAMYAPVFTIHVPINRLIANLEREAVENPDDFLPRMNLGRLYGMAYSLKTDTLETKIDSSVWFGYEPGNVPHNRVTETEDEEKIRIAAEHIEKAVYWYEEALKLAPDDLVVKLGYGWCLDRAGRDVEAKNVYIAVGDTSYERDRNRYDKQYNLPYSFGNRSIVVEAYRYAIAILDTIKDKEELKRINDILNSHDQMYRITPIVIPLTDSMQLNHIIDNDQTVSFDLDGTGVHEWNWINREAGWLVHDYDGDGMVDSGRDLFGNITFWLFWRNGYDALRALDDNGDGELRGSELIGLAGWQDVNSNGISDNGEVMKLGKLGIDFLSCSYTDTTFNRRRIWFSPEGVGFTDGTIRPTYDIILEMKLQAEIASGSDR